MKTTFDQSNILYSVLNVSLVTDAITGSIYKDVRPNSKKEDIVISSLPVVGNGQQIGQANVNIYVPSIPVTTEGQTMVVPNNPRLAEISAIVVDRIKAHIGSDYNVTIANSKLIEEKEYHFYNVKVNFEFLNLE